MTRDTHETVVDTLGMARDTRWDSERFSRTDLSVC